MIRRRMFLLHMAKADRFRAMAADCKRLSDSLPDAPVSMRTAMFDSYATFTGLADVHEARAVRWLPKRLQETL